MTSYLGEGNIASRCHDPTASQITLSLQQDLLFYWLPSPVLTKRVKWVRKFITLLNIFSVDDTRVEDSFEIYICSSCFKKAFNRAISCNVNEMEPSKEGFTQKNFISDDAP